MKSRWFGCGLLALASCQSAPKNIDPTALENAQVNGLMEQAASVRAGGDAKAAAALYAQAIGQTKSSVEPALALAQLDRDENDPEAAIAVLEKATARKPDEPRANGLLGKLYVARNDGASALAAFTHGLNAAPGDLDLMNGKGVALDLLGRHEEAQTVYLDALRQKPANADFIESNLALSYVMSGNPDAAIARLKASPGTAQSSVMRQNLALSYGVKGEMTEARQWGDKDVSPAEMDANIAFYQSYAEKLKREAAAPLPTKIDSELTEPASNAASKEPVDQAEKTNPGQAAIAAPVDPVTSDPPLAAPEAPAP